MSEQKTKVGFACAYTPLPLIHAAGFEPFRILPTGNSPDQAGSYIHDNMCPHVKRILDRAIADDVPELAGVVLMNSCDAMRRLADAWKVVRPKDRVVLVDLPSDSSDRLVAYFRDELIRLSQQLSTWTGRPITGQQIVDSTRLYNKLVDRLAELREKLNGTRDGLTTLQRVYAQTVTEPPEESLKRIDGLIDEKSGAPADPGVPIYLFGNLLPDPEAIELFSSCGCGIAWDDLCTGSRQLTSLAVDDPDKTLEQLAHSLLTRPACGRTFSAGQPGTLAAEVVARARELGVKGVVAHVMKFCDPYLNRLPAVRDELRSAGLPFLVLEGDCTMGSLGQQRTRIEAFVEMLGG